jgi:hypothetical protein
MQNRDVFENTDVISIWFDRMRPDSLHNAIYKVRACVYRGYSLGIMFSIILIFSLPLSGTRLYWHLRLELPFAWLDTCLITRIS